MPLNILYGPHVCKLTEAPSAAVEEVLRGLTVYEPKESAFIPRHFKGKGRYIQPDPRRYLYNKRTREFPTGLLPKVQEAFTCHILNEPVRLAANPYKISLEPRPYQSAACTALVLSGRGVAVLPTGTGKTCLVAMLASSYSDRKILVTTPNKRLLHQNHDEVSKFLGSEVGILGDSERSLNHNVVVCTIQSLVSRIEANDNEIVRFLECVDVWISDESHGAAADSYRTLSRFLPKAHIRFGTTATWIREDGCGPIMEGVLGSPVYEYTYDQAFKEGYLTPIRVWIRSMQHPNSSDNKPHYSTHYRSRIVENKARNLQIAIDAANLVDYGYAPTLVMVKQIDQGQLLAELLGCPFVNGDNPTRTVDQILNEFVQGLHPVIVASSILNVGVNLRELRSAVNAAGGDSRVDALQKPGRGLRLCEGKDFFEYVDYFDKDFSYFKQHSASRRSTYKMNFTGRVTDIVADKGIHLFIAEGIQPARFMEL